MSHRKTILRELSQTETGRDAYARPASIRGFQDAPEKYQKAVNELLSDRLLEGRKDEDGHMTIAINEHRLAEVKRELRPVWARPGVWVAAVLIAAVAFGAGLGSL